jgi:hypothetical protein
MQGLESVDQSLDCDHDDLLNKKRSYATTPGNRNGKANVKSKLEQHQDSKAFNQTYSNYYEPMSRNSNHNSGRTTSFNIQ